MPNKLIPKAGLAPSSAASGDPQVAKPMHSTLAAVLAAGVDPHGENASPFKAEDPAIIRDQARFDDPASVREGIEFELRPVIAAHEMDLDPLSAEGVRLLHKLCHDPSPATWARLKETVDVLGVKLGVRAHF